MVTNETQEQLEARGWDFTEEFIPDEPTVNNQDKTVDVSENGTIEVTPDEGFTGLGKVTVNTNVESGGSEYEYFALTDGWFKDLGATFAFLASLVKTQTSTFGVVILPAEYARIANNGDSIDPVAVAVDMSLILCIAGQQTTIKGSILASGTTEESLAKYRITKEQFYDLNA